jgi:rubrerythrin
MFLVEVTDADIVSTQTPVTYDFYQKQVKQPYKPAAKKVDGQANRDNTEAEGTKTNSYVCKICGYVYEGESLPEDYICPICKHGAADFEQI